MKGSPRITPREWPRLSLATLTHKNTIWAFSGPLLRSMDLLRPILREARTARAEFA